MSQQHDDTKRQVDDWLKDWASQAPSSMKRDTSNHVRVHIARSSARWTRTRVLVAAICVGFLGLVGLTLFQNQKQTSLSQEDASSLHAVQTRIEEIRWAMLQAEVTMLTETLNQMERDGDHLRQEIARESIKHQRKSEWLAHWKSQESSTFLQLP
jgi:uncharacterized protein YlxW (UPF0749 family)